jgi:antitoxin (DNA-binding transcriptional repressor) of toxin-antitoxin stability system
VHSAVEKEGRKMETTLDQAVKQLPRLFERAMQGEQVVIAGDDMHGVLLVPITNWKHGRNRKHDRKAGSGKGLFVMRDDFDEPVPGFEKYVP